MSNLINTLRKQSAEIAEKNHAGWGNTMNQAADRIEELQNLLMICDNIQTECVSEDGLTDAIDNDGELYQSQHLAMILEKARTTNAS